jgi:hypothetical protein
MGIFNYMGTRWIIHKSNGQTITSEWGSNETSFRKNWSEDITSIQLQREVDKKLYTLSARKNSKTIYWQTDDFVLDPSKNQSKMIARRIFRSLGDNNWLELNLVEGKEKPVVNIINKIIKVS